MINIEGKKYCLNLKRICEFSNHSDVHSTKESEILDNYGYDEKGKFDILSKSTREVTSQGNQQMDTIKYDLVKMLIGQLITFGYEEGDSEQEIPFGLEIVLNTLINEGFLIEIE